MGHLVLHASIAWQRMALVAHAFFSRLLQLKAVEGATSQQTPTSHETTNKSLDAQQVVAHEYNRNGGNKLDDLSCDSTFDLQRGFA